MTWASVLLALIKAVGDFLLGLIAQKDAARAHEDKGRAEGTADLHQTVSEAADEQAQINAADRGRAGDVLERLHKRIDPSRSP